MCLALSHQSFVYVNLGVNCNFKVYISMHVFLMKINIFNCFSTKAELVVVVCNVISFNSVHHYEE